MKKLIAVILPLLFLTGCSKTVETVCTIPEENSSGLTSSLKMTFVSKDGYVKEVEQKETTKLEGMDISNEEFKNASKELKKSYEKYKGLKYNYSYNKKNSEVVETLEIDCSKADSDTLTLMGLSINEQDLKDNEIIKISLKDSIKNMKSYGLECKEK